MKGRITLLMTTLLCLLFISDLVAQAINIFQFRHVPPDKVEEYIHRETHYWSQVAQKAVDEGKLLTWALLQKVGGYDIPNSSNILLINAFEDLDAANMGEIWNASNVFPDVPSEQLNTFGMSTVTSQAFVRPGEWIISTTNPSEDMNFVKFNFWKSSNPNQFVALEAEHWGPFIKAEMEKPESSQVGWGNAVILNPRGPNVPANTISFDFYKTLGDCLIPSWSEGAQFPEEGLTKLSEITESRTETIYRIVKVVTGN